MAPVRRPLFLEKGVQAFLFLALLPRGQHQFASLVTQQDSTAFDLAKIMCTELAAIDQRQRQPVCQRSTQLFHEIKREAGAAGAIPVQKADCRIKTNRLGCGTAVMRQKGLKER